MEIGKLWVIAFVRASGWAQTKPCGLPVFLNFSKTLHATEILNTYLKPA
jgi:hypothetical protein